MHAPTVTTHDFVTSLQTHADKRLAFEYDGRRIRPGYHVTEIKAASYRSLDCGARPQQWEETIVQLWDVADKPEQGHMSVRKFLAIYGKVSRDVGLNGDAEIKFEWGDADMPAVFYTLNSMREDGTLLVASLEPVRATCKPRDEWWLQTRSAETSACCGAQAATSDAVALIATSAIGIGEPCCVSPSTGAPQRTATVKIQPDDIRNSVRDYYADRAKTGSACCSNTLHDVTLLEGLPEDIAGFTLGCGDAVSLANLQPGETVIDLGSGGGLECFMAAKLVGANGRVIGVDMTPEMLSKAWSGAVRLRAGNVDFRYGFLEALPVPDGTADVIMSNCVINLSPDKAQVFREMFRALKPGGRVTVSDIVSDGELPEAVQRDMALWGGCYAGALDKAVYAQGLRAAGFVDVRVEPRGGAADEVESLKGKIFSAAITARKP